MDGRLKVPGRGEVQPFALSNVDFPQATIIIQPLYGWNAAALATPKVLGQDETMWQCDRFIVDWLRKADVENIIV